MSCRKERNGMVEITGTELVALEQRAHNGNLTKNDVRKIFALIVQQQACIEQQAAEIAKKDKVIEKAIGKLFILPDRDECPDDGDCYCLPRQKEQRDPDIGDCRKCWLAWLESEAEV